MIFPCSDSFPITTPLQKIELYLKGRGHLYLYHLFAMFCFFRDEEALYVRFMKEVTNEVLDRGIYTDRWESLQKTINNSDDQRKQSLLFVPLVIWNSCTNSFWSPKMRRFVVCSKWHAKHLNLLGSTTFPKCLTKLTLSKPDVWSSFSQLYNTLHS